MIMELRFNAMLYSNSGNENSDAGHIRCSRGPHLAHGPQVPHPSSRRLVTIASAHALVLVFCEKYILETNDTHFYGVGHDEVA